MSVHGVYWHTPLFMLFYSEQSETPPPKVHEGEEAQGAVGERGLASPSGNIYLEGLN